MNKNGNYIKNHVGWHKAERACTQKKEKEKRRVGRRWLLMIDDGDSINFVILRYVIKLIFN